MNDLKVSQAHTPALKQRRLGNSSGPGLTPKGKKVDRPILPPNAART